jgi:hypothetical protein
MLKLTASYSKKVPASEEYSSQHYHAGVEVEIPENLPPAELRRRIQNTFALVRASVEAELHGDEQRAAPAIEDSADYGDEGPTTDRPTGKEPVRLASRKQVTYLIDLATRNGHDLPSLNRMAAERHGVRTVYDLSRHQASKLIDSLSARPDRRAA